ncbi:sigma-70 family RNA polymerase sigma factor [Calothrix sp. 336/3]|uniref:sigma-70 family RNA polymerase sigma factor n=1 Tax=Calothrix sp. 336/3 TaxID=1337936 RepID=UPI0004E3477E|nr:sigma-70 family RNA polymerase sigma factor [Calothrix sp. 336/3]AKG20884.1 group 3/4 sigma-70 RNA polymerase sigma factor [Calothrix sp. 336/3]
MRPRQNITELFSTFLQFTDDRFAGWTTDARLHRSIKVCVNQYPEATGEDFWAVYWHKSWQKSPQPAIPLGHMSAYLQESCYWTVHNLMPRLPDSHDKVSDFFQVAIASVPKILKSCDPDVNLSLKAYASRAFGNIIRDYLRQNREADFCNHWGLLMKVSRKRLTESLENAGLNPATIEQYVLAWTCLTTIHLPRKSPNLRQTPAPEPSTWMAIASNYNRMRLQLTSPGAEVTAPTLEKWLIECGTQVRKYLYPSVSSLNSPKPGQEEGQLQDELVDALQQPLLTELIEREEEITRQAQKAQINKVLQAAITQLDTSAQQLLQLYYQKGLTQQQIAKELAIQQYTVSRKLSKARESLLLILTRWSQETLHIPITSDVVKYISTILEEWLQVHYQTSSPTP